jgi:hypothetical protein
VADAPRLEGWNSEIRALYRQRLHEFLVAAPPHNLTDLELALVLPPRGPQGAPENQYRGWAIRQLNHHGYTYQGKPL